MDWSNWINVLIVAMLVLCCGAMMLGMGHGRHRKQDKHEEQEKRHEDVGKK